MAPPATSATDADVEAFLATVENAVRVAECRAVMGMMQRATGEPPRMWGSSIIGFGRYHYRYDSGREGDWMITGVAPRKAALSVYIMDGFTRHDDLLGRLGKFSHGRSCLYVKRLADVDQTALEELVRRSVARMRETYSA